MTHDDDRIRKEGLKIWLIRYASHYLRHYFLPAGFPVLLPGWVVSRAFAPRAENGRLGGAYFSEVGLCRGPHCFLGPLSRKVPQRPIGRDSALATGGFVPGGLARGNYNDSGCSDQSDVH